jgi:hypothetical protein
MTKKEFRPISEYSSEVTFASTCLNLNQELAPEMAQAFFIKEQL